MLQILIPQCVEIDLNQDQDKVEMFVLMNNSPIVRILAEKVFKVFHGDDVSTCKIKVTQIHIDLASLDLSFRVSGLPIEAQNLSFKKE